MQTSASEKYAQDNYGKFDESEHQTAIGNDDDYQELEYNYRPLNIGSIGFYDIDKYPPAVADCAAIWKRTVGNLSGSSFWRAFRKYAEKCPTEFLFNFCCGKGLRVRGPVNNQLASGQVFKFGYSGGGVGCHYEFGARRGRMMLDGEYTAPTTWVTITDNLWIQPFLGDDHAKHCLEWKVKIISANCSGETIGVASQQLETGEKVTLTVVGAIAGVPYSWNIQNDGPGKLSGQTTTTINYTAPDTNPGCTNPTIELLIGEGACDTVTLAINGYKAVDPAYYMWTSLQTGTCAWTRQRSSYKCNGEFITGSECGVSCSSAGVDCKFKYGDTDYFCTGTGVIIWCQTMGSCGPVCSGVQDIRTEGMKASGCCPLQLV
jgi:hypothetical protein